VFLFFLFLGFFLSFFFDLVQSAGRVNHSSLFCSVWVDM
jgi:hypothetical protein